MEEVLVVIVGALFFPSLWTHCMGFIKGETVGSRSIATRSIDSFGRFQGIDA